MHPVLLKIGIVEIRFYSLMYVLAVVLSFYFLRAEISRKKIQLSQNEILNLILYSVAFGIVGARLYYVLFRWDYFGSNLSEIIYLRHGGLASHGGFIAGSIVGYFYLKHYKVSFPKIADSAVPIIVLCEACVRFGNFMNGEAHGIPTSLPWGIVFPLDSLAGNQFPNVPVHPTMLYQLFYNIFAFWIIWSVFRKGSYKNGSIAALTVILYSVGRFFIEGLRADSLYLGHFRIAQIVCIILVFSMIFILFRGRVIENYAPLFINRRNDNEGSLK